MPGQVPAQLFLKLIVPRLNENNIFAQYSSGISLLKIANMNEDKPEGTSAIHNTMMRNKEADNDNILLQA